MSGAPVTTGFFGKIPATGDFVGAGLPRVFIDRWDRWMSMELGARPDEGELDSRVWRFTVPAGIFGPEPCSGVWRMSEDRVGRRYPFVIAAIGVTPAMEDPWFEAVAEIARLSIVEGWLREKIENQIARLAPPEPGSTGGGGFSFWSDDWEVQELHFSDIHDLADNGLPAMRASPMVTEML